MMRNEIYDITDAIYEAERDNSKGHSLVKRLAATKKRLEVRLEKLADESRKDDLLNFEQLGVDYLFVDESQNYKNLFLYTKMNNIAGIPQTQAKKSTDMFLKTQYISEENGGARGVVFATGTPISNSMAEMFTVQRYLSLERLRSLNLEMFDAWAGSFGEKVTAMELAPDGSGYRQKERFSRFFNVPELMTLFREFADIQTADMLNLPVPECEFATEVAPPSDELIEFIGELMVLAEQVRTGAIDPTIANMLTITNEGRKAALDIRLVKPDAPDLPDSKINKAVSNIFHIWQDTKADKLTQLVFSDLSTPNVKGFNVYDDIREKLVNMGIPQEEICFIHEAKTDRQKDTLFEAVRRGDVRVLIGSTPKMGAGTNVQDKLVALHHLDVPWRPSDVTQREGRILRQGNKNEKVQIFRYITEKSFDSYSWQIIENKQRFISQIMTGRAVARSVEDIDQKALSYAELKAIATGDPRILRKAEIDSEVMRLETLASQYRFNRYRLEDSIRKSLPQNIAKTQEVLAALEQDISWRDQNVRGEFQIQIGSNTYSERKDAGVRLLATLKKLPEDGEKLLGEYGGFKLYGAVSHSWVGDIKTTETTLRLKHGLSYPIKISDDAVGIITRIENRTKKMDENFSYYNTQLSDYKTQHEKSKQEYDRPFAYADELATLKNEQQELTLALNLDKVDEPVIGESTADLAQAQGNATDETDDEEQEYA